MRTSLQIVKAVIFALVLREFLGRFMKRRMGAAWTLLEPFLHVFVLTLVFTYLRGRHVAGVEYPIYLICGLVPFFLFRNIAIRLMDGVEANRALFAYKQIKPLDTFIARAIVESMLMGAVYLLLIFIFGWSGFDVSVYNPLQWFATLILGITLAFSLGVGLAIFTHALPDTKMFIRMLFLPLYFISGVVYPASALPARYLPYFLWNPFLHLSELLRTFMFEHYRPVAGISFGYVVEVVVVLTFASLGMYRVRRLKIIAI